MMLDLTTVNMIYTDKVISIYLFARSNYKILVFETFSNVHKQNLQHVE